MIIGISHITYTCWDISQSIEKFKRRGFELKFIEKSMKSDENKNIFLSQKSFFHDIALMTYIDGIALELVSYNRRPDGCAGSIFPIYRNSIWSGQLITKKNKCGLMHEIQNNSILIMVDNYRESLNFWTNVVGYKIIEETVVSYNVGTKKRLVKLLRPSPIGRLTSCLFLCESSGKNSNAFLDSPGSTCVSYITSDIKKDYDNLILYGKCVGTGIFSVTVNENDFFVSIVSCPGGMYIELLQLKRVLNAKKNH